MAQKHYKIEYTGNGNDGTAADHVYTLVGYSMLTEFPGVAADWLNSVQAGYPYLRLRLADPDRQALADALNGVEDSEGIIAFESLYHDPLPLSAPQYGDEPRTEAINEPA
jgi:hypothetical protein